MPRMPTIKDDALILDHHPFKDRHLVVTALTRSHGLIRGVLRSARGGKTPAAGAVQLLSRVHVEYFHRATAELATFNRVELDESSFPLAMDLRRSAAAAVVAELLLAFCPADEPAPRRYRLASAALDALLAGIDVDRVVAYVQFWVLQLGGLMPPPEQIADETDSDELVFLIGCRTVPLSDLDLDAPPPALRRLDSMVRAGAERPLRALDFFRTHGG